MFHVCPTDVFWWFLYGKLSPQKLDTFLDGPATILLRFYLCCITLASLLSMSGGGSDPSRSNSLLAFCNLQTQFWLILTLHLVVSLPHGSTSSADDLMRVNRMLVLRVEEVKWRWNLWSCCMDPCSRWNLRSCLFFFFLFLAGRWTHWIFDRLVWVNSHFASSRLSCV